MIKNKYLCNIKNGLLPAIKLCLWIGLGVSHPAAQAYVMRLENVNDTSPGQIMTPAAQALVDEFNGIMGASASHDFLSALGNANAGSSRSQFTPGAVTSNHILVGIYGAGAAALGSDTTFSGIGNSGSNQLPGIGVGAKLGLTVGLSGQIVKIPLPLDPSKTMWLLSFSTMSFSKYLKNITLNSSQFGLGLSYELQSPIGWNPILRWNGIRVTTGLTYSAFEVGYKTPFSLSQNLGGGASVKWAADLDLGAKSWLTTLSTEATTGVRLFWFWNLYTGVGIDFNAGGTNFTGGSKGKIVSDPAGPPGYEADAIIEPGKTGYGPSIVSARYLLGTQFDLGPVGLYLQGQLAVPSVYVLNVGTQFQF